MKNTFLIFLLTLVAGLPFLNSSCKETEEPPVQTGPEVRYNNYLLAGSYGDLIGFGIDKARGRYRFNNETMGMVYSGNFSMSTHPQLTNVYEIMRNGAIYYCIELPGKMMATSVPSGNHANLLCFGLSDDKNIASLPAAAFAGKYLWVVYDDIEEFTWGGMEVFANGTFTWQIGPDDDNDFDAGKHFAGGGNGVWKVSVRQPNRIEFIEKGDTLFGTMLDNKMLMIDNGPGKGFTAGVRYPDAPLTQASIAGSYKWLDVTPEGYRGVGYFNLPASGTDCEYFYKYYNNPYAREGKDTMFNFRRSTKINNAFIGEDDWDGERFYTGFFVLPGETMLFYTWGDNGLVSYGVACKVE